MWEESWFWWAWPRQFPFACLNCPDDRMRIWCTGGFPQRFPWGFSFCEEGEVVACTFAFLATGRDVVYKGCGARSSPVAPYVGLNSRSARLTVPSSSLPLLLGGWIFRYSAPNTSCCRPLTRSREPRGRRRLTAPSPQRLPGEAQEKPRRSRAFPQDDLALQPSGLQAGDVRWRGP